MPHPDRQPNEKIEIYRYIKLQNKCIEIMGSKSFIRIEILIPFPIFSTNCLKIHNLYIHLKKKKKHSILKTTKQ